MSGSAAVVEWRCGDLLTSSHTRTIIGRKVRIPALAYLRSVFRKQAVGDGVLVFPVPALMGRVTSTVTVRSMLVALAPLDARAKKAPMLLAGRSD